MQNIKPLQTSKKIISNKEAMEELERYEPPKEEPKETKVPKEELKETKPETIDEKVNKETNTERDNFIGITLKTIDVYLKQNSKDISIDSLTNIFEELSEKPELKDTWPFGIYKVNKGIWYFVLHYNLDTLFGLQRIKVDDKGTIKLTKDGESDAQLTKLLPKTESYLMEIVRKY